jgi:hypothetical protein
VPEKRVFFRVFQVFLGRAHFGTLGLQNPRVPIWAQILAPGLVLAHPTWNLLASISRRELANPTHLGRSVTMASCCLQLVERQEVSRGDTSVPDVHLRRFANSSSDIYDRYAVLHRNTNLQRTKCGVYLYNTSKLRSVSN